MPVEQLEKILEYARLSHAAYMESLPKKLAERWTEKPGKINEKSGLVIKVYEEQIKDGRIVIAIRGTEFTLEDWKHNILQGAGLRAEQYEKL